jgi:hypothetical protein
MRLLSPNWWTGHGRSFEMSEGTVGEVGLGLAKRDEECVLIDSRTRRSASPELEQRAVVRFPPYVRPDSRTHSHTFGSLDPEEVQAGRDDPSR